MVCERNFPTLLEKKECRFCQDVFRLLVQGSTGYKASICDQSCKNVEKTLGQYPDIFRLLHYKRYFRRIELENPVNKSKRKGVQKLRKLSHSDTLLLWQIGARSIKLCEEPIMFWLESL